MTTFFENLGPYFKDGKVYSSNVASVKEETLLKNLEGVQKGKPKQLKFKIDLDKILDDQENSYPLNPKSIIQLYKSFEDVNRSKPLTGHIVNVSNDTVYVAFYAVENNFQEGKILPIPIEDISYKTSKTYTSGKIYQFYFKKPEDYKKFFNLKKPY